MGCIPFFEHLSLAPRLQPGAKRHGTTSNRFNGLPGAPKPLKRLGTAVRRPLTGLKPGVNERLAATAQKLRCAQLMTRDQ